MPPRLRVGVIFGGQSGEHEVSLASARSVIAALDPAKYEVVPIGITHRGRWLTGGDPMALLTAGDAESMPDESTPSAALAAPSTPSSRELVPGATGQRFPTLDVVFPVLHGTYGEDGTVQGLLELAGVAYVGCGVLASAVGMDKIACKAVFAAAGLPQPRYLPINAPRLGAQPGGRHCECRGRASLSRVRETGKPGLQHRHLQGAGRDGIGRVFDRCGAL